MFIMQFRFGKWATDWRGYLEEAPIYCGIPFVDRWDSGFQRVVRLLDGPVPTISQIQIQPSHSAVRTRPIFGQVELPDGWESIG